MATLLIDEQYYWSVKLISILHVHCISLEFPSNSVVKDQENKKHLCEPISILRKDEILCLCINYNLIY